MLHEHVFPRPNWRVPTLAFVFLACAGGCGGEPTSVAVAALGITTDSLVINNGQASTRSTTVTLTITTSPSNRPLTMCVTNTSTCTFVPFARTKPWLLTPGDGSKTVSVTLDDQHGTQTALQATVQLDTTAPVAGSLTATPSDALVSLAWDVASDALSGIQSYRLMMSPLITPPSCTYGQRIYEGTDTSFEHTTVRNGSTYGYRVCPVDSAGNVGVGAIALARPAPEYDPPIGTVTINGGALLSRSHSVTLDLDAVDASPIASVCISQDSTCTNFVAWSTTKPWTLRGPVGPATVNVWFRDIYGNTSAPAQATITVDTLTPSRSTLTARTRVEGVIVEWTAATDTNGIASYTLVWVAGSVPPASCTAGTLAYTGTDLTYTDTVGPSGTRSYRLCATDQAGNTNLGVTKTALQLSNVLSNIITPASAQPFTANADAAAPAAVLGLRQRLRHDALIARELPSWAEGLSRAELMNALHEQIAQSALHVRDQFYAWDVVNEAIDDDTLELRAGIPATLGVSGLAQLYKWVEEADPALELYYNDYGVEGSNAKTVAVYGLIEDLIAQGARIDGVEIRPPSGR
jgi:hypothetical protein